MNAGYGMRAAMVLALVAVLGLAGCAAPGTGGQGGALVSAPPGDGAELLTRAQFGPNDGEAARSEALFISVLRRVPTEGETWFRLGNLYANNNRPEPAAAAYNRALMADNANARAYHNLGVIRLRQAYATLLQGQLAVDPSDADMVKRVDELVEQLSRVSALRDQAEARTAPPRETAK